MLKLLKVENFPAKLGWGNTCWDWGYMAPPVLSATAETPWAMLGRTLWHTHKCQLLLISTHHTMHIAAHTMEMSSFFSRLHGRLKTKYPAGLTHTALFIWLKDSFYFSRIYIQLLSCWTSLHASPWRWWYATDNYNTASILIQHLLGLRYLNTPFSL